MKSTLELLRYAVRGSLMTLCIAPKSSLKSAFLFFKYAVLGSFLFFTVALSQPDTLSIIHVNDTHSTLLPYGAGKHGGMARAASIIGMWRQTEPNPITIHGGDLMVWIIQ